MKHHSLDPYPIPKEKSPMFINEPWLVDRSLMGEHLYRELEEKEDNIRICVPIWRHVRNKKICC